MASHSIAIVQVTSRELEGNQWNSQKRKRFMPRMQCMETVVVILVSVQEMIMRFSKIWPVNR